MEGKEGGEGQEGGVVMGGEKQWFVEKREKGNHAVCVCVWLGTSEILFSRTLWSPAVVI